MDKLYLQNSRLVHCLKLVTKKIIKYIFNLFYTKIINLFITLTVFNIFSTLIIIILISFCVLVIAFQLIFYFL